MSETGTLFDTGPAAKPQTKRRERDAYFTPAWATSALLAAFPEIRGGRLLDPCCGDGRMARALAPRFQQTLLNDIEPVGDQHLVEPTREDATRVELYTRAQADWIVSNLPFNLAGPMAWQCVRGARVGRRCSAEPEHAGGPLLGLYSERADVPKSATVVAAELSRNGTSEPGYRPIVQYCRHGQIPPASASSPQSSWLVPGRM